MCGISCFYILKQPYKADKGIHYFQRFGLLQLLIIEKNLQGHAGFNLARLAQVCHWHDMGFILNKGKKAFGTKLQ